MTDDLVQRLRSNRPIPTLPHEAADRIEALSLANQELHSENERLREHLISALDTLKDAEVCDDNCGPCNEAWAALQEKSK